MPESGVNAVNTSAIRSIGGTFVGPEHRLWDMLKLETISQHGVDVLLPCGTIVSVHRTLPLVFKGVRG